MVYTYKYPRPMVTVDILLFDISHKEVRILLIKRKNSPFAGQWAFPGGFVDKDEPLQVAAERELKEETNIENFSLKQFKAYGDPGRDPRGHTISVVFYTLINNENISAIAGDDASDAKWFSVSNLPPLAFDHDKIIKEAINKVL